MRVRVHLVRMRGLAWKLGIPVVAVATVGQLALSASAGAAHTVASVSRTAGTIKPAKVNNLDCNGWSTKYTAASSAMKKLCTDPLSDYDGKATRFYENGHYVGHDEPSVKFISSVKGSGNTMSYAMRIPKDPKKRPTPSGSVVDYGQLSVAPWFGLPMCDPKSYPQNPCKPDSDSNLGGINDTNAAGSAFMELQFYPPGFTPFVDSESCSATQWCAALTIDSLECNFGFETCNSGCEEPVNFSFLQTNGVPPGPPAPQDPDLKTFLGNAQTLKINPGDVITVSISDPSGGLLAKVHDVTTGQTGWIQASAKNGFANTSLSTCAGTPFTFHAEYSTAKKKNQVPWAALEGGVLMEQEIGHSEVCNSLAHRDGFTESFSDGSLVDPKVYETCDGGSEGKKAIGEGPCNTTTGACTNSTTEGKHGPVACPDSNFLTSTDLCEFADGYCFPQGTRSATVAGTHVTESSRANECFADQFQNGDLDWDGLSYLKDWPNGNPNWPQAMEYLGPFSNGHTYSKIQFESDAPASEALCDTSTGAGCTIPPGGAPFYPFWTLNNKQTMRGLVDHPGACIWNFGDVTPHVTTADFRKDKQYGKPDIARYGGTTISKVLPNSALTKSCT
jgi:hypothetical protein